ncbi:uncharacterized protein LOC144596455 [Rhinoraja longicauda]
MSAKKKGREMREKAVRRAADGTAATAASGAGPGPGAATAPTAPTATGEEGERELLRHELMNLQQMNLSLQAVLHMVVSFKKTIEEVIQNSDHLAELNEGWSTFFGMQRSRIPN